MKGHITVWGKVCGSQREEQGFQNGNFMANFKKIGHFCSALAKKTHLAIFSFCHCGIKFSLNILYFWMDFVSLCTVIGFTLDWESHKSLKHDRECLTKLLDRACFQPYPIQRIQLAEVCWESDNKGFEWKRGWVVCIKFCATFSALVRC